MPRVAIVGLACSTFLILLSSSAVPQEPARAGANAVSFGILWFYRTGDANMRSAWICTRNDVLGNLAVLLAALGVFGTGTGWPDLVVAATMATLALQGASTVLRQSLGELRQPHPVAMA